MGCFGTRCGWSLGALCKFGVDILLQGTYAFTNGLPVRGLNEEMARLDSYMLHDFSRSATQCVN
jgi:hypothetical protein